MNMFEFTPKILKIILITISTSLLSQIYIYNVRAAVIIEDGTSDLCVEPKGIDHYFPNDGKDRRGVPSNIIGLTDGQNPYYFKSSVPIKPSDVSISINSDYPSSLLDGILYRLLPYPDAIADEIDLNGKKYSEIYALVPGQDNSFNESTIPFAMYFTEYGVDGKNAQGGYSFPGGSDDNLFDWLTSAKRIDYQNYINEEVFPAQQNTNGLSADNTTTFIPMFIACIEVYNSDTKQYQTQSFPIYTNQIDGINLENHTAKEAFYSYTSDMSQLFSGEWGTDVENIGRIDVTRRFSSIINDAYDPSVGLDQEDSILNEKLKYEKMEGVDCRNPEAWLPGRFKETGVYQIPEVDQCAQGSCGIIGTISGFLRNLLGNLDVSLSDLILGDEYTLYLFTDTYMDAMAKYYNRTQDLAFWEFANIEGITDIPGDPSFIVAREDDVQDDEKYLIEEWYDPASFEVCVAVQGAGQDCRMLTVKSPNVRTAARYCQMLANTQVEGMLDPLGRTGSDGEEIPNIPGYDENNCDDVLESLYTLDSRYDLPPGSSGPGGRTETDDFDIEINVAPAELFGDSPTGPYDVQLMENEDLPTVLRWNLNVTAKYPTTGLDIKNEVSVFNNTFDSSGEVTGEKIVERILEAPFLEVSVNGETVSDEILNGFSISESGYELNSAGNDIVLNGDLIKLNSIRFDQIQLNKGDRFTMVFETAAYNAKPYFDSKVQYKVTVDGLSIDKGVNIDPGTVFMGLYGRPNGWGSLRKASTASGMVNMVSDYISKNGQYTGAVNIIGLINLNIATGTRCGTGLIDIGLAREVAQLAQQNGMIVMFDIQPVDCEVSGITQIMKDYYFGDNVTFDIDLEWATPSLHVNEANQIVDYYYNNLGGTLPVFGFYYFGGTGPHLSGDYANQSDERITPLMDGFGSCPVKINVTKYMVESIFGKSLDSVFGGMEFTTAWGTQYDNCPISTYFTDLKNLGGVIFLGQ